MVQYIMKLEFACETWGPAVGSAHNNHFRTNCSALSSIEQHWSDYLSMSYIQASLDWRSDRQKLILERHWYSYNSIECERSFHLFHCVFSERLVLAFDPLDREAEEWEFKVRGDQDHINILTKILPRDIHVCFVLSVFSW